MPGDDAERQADRQQADEGRVLQDVDEDADLEEVLDGDRADQEDGGQDPPDQVIQHEADGSSAGAAGDAAAAARPRGFYSTTFTGSVGGLEVAPEARVVDVGLGDRRTRDLEVGAPGLDRSARSRRPWTS